MAQTPTIKVKVIDPNKILYEGEATIVYAPGRRGTLGILPNHTPMFAELLAGDILIIGEQEDIITIESGILKIRENQLTILIGPK